MWLNLYVHRGWIAATLASLVLLSAQAVPVSAQATSSASMPKVADPTRPPQGTVVNVPAEKATGHAIDILVGRHQVKLQPVFWLTYVKTVDDPPWCCPVDLCGYGGGDTFVDVPVVMAGYAHDICDQLDVVSQAMVDFDLKWLADIGRKTIYKAELRYVEEPQDEHTAGGGQMSVFNCVTHIAPMADNGYWTWIASTLPPHTHLYNVARDANGEFPLPMDVDHTLDVNGGRVNLTQLVGHALAYPRQYAGFALLGDTLSTDGDHDACWSKVSNFELLLDYEVLQ